MSAWHLGIAHARELVGASKAEIARRVGCDKSFVTHIENGTKLPSLGMFERIAVACGLTASQLARICERLS